MSPDSSLMEPTTIVATQEPPLLDSSKILSKTQGSSSSPATSLKVVIVGNEGVGKTSFVRRIVSEELDIPIEDVTSTASSSAFSLSSPSPLQCHPRGRRERPPGTISTGSQHNSEVGLDIFELELPSTDETSSSDVQGRDTNNGNMHRLSIWDFSGNPESLQAVQQVFFTSQTLYVVLWDMAAKDLTPLESSSMSNHSQRSIRSSRRSISGSTHNNGSRSQSYRSVNSSTFNLGYDSDSDSSDYEHYNDCDVDMYNQEELRVLKRSLEKDIDRNVQRYIDRIQLVSPGATILPIATHTDRLTSQNRSDLADSTTDGFQQKESKKRCRLLKERLLSNESRKVEVLKQKKSITGNGSEYDSFERCLSRPNILFGNVQKDGQVIPHAIAAAYRYDKDIDKGEEDSSEMLLETHLELVHEYEESFSSVRKFIIDTALSMAVGGEQQEKQEKGHGRKNLRSSQDSFIGRDEESVHASLATVMLRDVREKLWHRSKIVQTNYFTEKFKTREHKPESLINFHRCDETNFRENSNAVQSALNSLHLSGELCYFGGEVLSRSELQSQGTMILSDFVVLDPTWLVESIDFILRYGKKFVQNIADGRTSTDENDSSSPQRATNCPTIEKEEVRRLWKNRYSTKQGLGLAEHYHQFQQSRNDSTINKGVADQVFEFIQNLLIRHDVFVPLSYQKSGSRHFFLPCFLQKKEDYISRRIHSSQNTSLVPPPSILQNLAHSNSFIPENERYTDSKVDLDSTNLKGACHGYIIVGTAPETLMERTIVHSIKALKRILNTNSEPKIETEELFLWNDSFRLKLRVLSSKKRQYQSIEINSILLEAPGGGANSRSVTCDSMLVTYLQGCDNSESQEIWRQACLEIRQAIQNSFDEIPGIEYREEGICPHCLRNKRITDTGTWTLSKLKSAFDNKEAFVRCRHGHRTETKMNGLLHYQLVQPQRRNTTKNMFSQQSYSAETDRSNYHFERYSNSTTKSKSLKNQSTCLPLSQKCGRKRENPSLGVIDDHRNMQFSSPTDSTAKIQPGSRMLLTPIKAKNTECGEQRSQNDLVFNSKVILLLDRCKSRMGRLFRRKNHLALDNCNITDCQIPMEKLKETKFGNHLQSMSLSYNKLEILPQSLVLCLPNLRVLNLSHCLIYELPKRWKLPLLKKLDISQNLLITFPEENMLLGLLELEELNLSGNKLTEVNISENPLILKKLRKLDLSSNELTIFPTCLNRLATLKSLDLHCNNIRDEQNQKS